MNESQFEEFLSGAVEAVKAKNALLEQRHGIGDFARWDHDGDLDQLTFSNPGEGGDADTLLAQTTDIGSYSLNTRTWLWAWDNPSHTDAARAKAAKLKELFDVTGMRLFTDAQLDCDEELAWELAAASVEHLGGIGLYRGPVGHLWCFWSIDTLRVTKKA